MTTISANSLFHFTPLKDNLLGILETGFRPAYSPEFGKSTNGKVNECEIAMVCFCDLPISNLRKHIGLDGTKGYGKYGLGMTKEWGMTNKLNPVTYFTNQSHQIEAGLEASTRLLKLSQHYDEEMDKMTKKYGGPKSTPYSDEEKNMIATYTYIKSAFEASNVIMNHMKPYQDAINGIRYYNEREWRLVVPCNEKNNYEVPVIWPTMFPHQLLKKPIYKDIISKKYMLNFSAIDVKYIIVENDAAVKDVVDKLASLPHKYSESDRNRLISRIVTCEQIDEDF
ncbi:hypothetical protein GO730_00495 [Spirosoma sp. HMF3257]|uniref:DUF2971 domain-containing protein n=1 Tax=Spirosoma telluris TaxID=2183553 RepID=A0A327NDC6_9BACT|nr:hypothetical protein [Spirosoma telluris]RAI73281.1 hypothetical protein HMF3257_00485 [Spirosoma telluris]